MSRFYFNNINRSADNSTAPPTAPTEPVEQPQTLSTFNMRVPATLAIPDVTQAGIYIYYLSESVPYPQLQQGITKYGISYKGVSYAMDANDHLHITLNHNGTEQVQVIDQQNMNWQPIIETLDDISEMFQS